MTKQELMGTTAFITGGSKGLGRSMALALARAGASVFITSKDAMGISETCKLEPERITGEVADLRDDDAVKQAIDSCLSTFDHLNVVINNAGVGMIDIRSNWVDEPVRFWEPNVEDVRRFFEIDAIGPFKVARYTLPLLQSQGWGRFVTVTTSLDTMTRRGQMPYGPAKAASEALASVMAHDLDGSGITSNVLIPGGAVDTEMVPTPRGLERTSLLRAEIMGPPIVWLASRASDGVTAKRITANRWDPEQPIEERLREAVRPIAWSSDRDTTSTW